MISVQPECVPAHTKTAYALAILLSNGRTPPGNLTHYHILGVAPL